MRRGTAARVLICDLCAVPFEDCGCVQLDWVELYEEFRRRHGAKGVGDEGNEGNEGMKGMKDGERQGRHRRQLRHLSRDELLWIRAVALSGDEFLSVRAFARRERYAEASVDSVAQRLYWDPPRGVKFVRTGRVGEWSYRLLDPSAVAVDPPSGVERGGRRSS